ncbi:unnamed protein product [Closterium sp. NIES-53]
MWVYPLKQKDHAASTIREDWLPFVEKQAECVVKRIRTDQGGEFLGAEMTAWLKKQGIQRELTMAYTPQSNGVAIRVNRTIQDTARALLIESGVGNSMWPHAVRHATGARNRVLTEVGNESLVLLERWLGRKPPVDMLRVFGCMAVAHVPKKYRSKLGASAIWCVHLGLAAESRGWLLWEPSKGVLFDSRDVKFFEGMMYGGWKKHPETKVSQQMEQITMQLDLTPSVWEEGEEAAAKGGNRENVQEEPAGGGGGVEASGSTSGAAGPEGADVAEQQLGNEEALLILSHGYDPDEEDEPAYYFLAPAPESMEEAFAGPDRENSSCEAEIYIGAMAAQELRWLTYLLTDLGEQPRSPPVLYVDNKAMIALCQEHRLEHRTKHIALRYFLARELQQRGELRLSYVATRANTADVFTKALPPSDHPRFVTVLGLLAVLFLTGLLLRSRMGNKLPLLHLRDIDDGFICSEGSREGLEEYLATFNALRPSIKLTWTISEVPVDFLDLFVHKGQRYRKHRSTGHLHLPETEQHLP